jgi:hypothetical protein
MADQKTSHRFASPLEQLAVKQQLFIFASDGDFVCDGNHKRSKLATSRAVSIFGVAATLADRETPPWWPERARALVREQLKHGAETAIVRDGRSRGRWNARLIGRFPRSAQLSALDRSRGGSVVGRRTADGAGGGRLRAWQTNGIPCPTSLPIIRLGAQ